MQQHAAPNRAQYYERLINLGVSQEEAERLTSELFGWLHSLPRA
jgi:hypothetical protein